MNEKDLIEVLENEIVYYKPHVHIYFVGDDMTRYHGASFEKFFETKEKMQDYCDKIINDCKEKNIQIKNIEEL